ncbi:MAG: DegT/DnrJ/EryC1/StrS family aminotransferase [Candidatus Aminicenantes bacterium]
MNIPLLDLKAQFQSIKNEVEQKIKEVISSQRFILGSEVESLEKEVAAYCGTRYAVGVSSGSDALLASLMALEVGEGDEVVTTPFTFFATAGAIARLGARPVFCDIHRESFNIDSLKLEKLLEDRIKDRADTRVKVILPVHLYGQCADMEPILGLAGKYNFTVMEDAAQAIGSEYAFSEGVKKAGAMGDVNILSFFPSKNLGGFGDGGMVLTDEQGLAEKLKLLRVHGSRNKYYYETIGGNFRLDALQAGILRVKLGRLNQWLGARREKASYYDQKFEESGLKERNLVFPPQPLLKPSGIKSYHTYHQYVIRAQKRDELQKFLKEKGISTAVYYPLPLHLQKCFSYLGYKQGDFPESEKASRQVLALPIYPELNSRKQDYIVQSISQFYNRG